MELLTSCFPCCCPPEAASRVTSELKLIEEPGVRPPYHHRLGSTLSVDGDAGETPTSSGAGPSSGGGDTPPHLYPSDTAKLLPGEGAPAGAIRFKAPFGLKKTNSWPRRGHANAPAPEAVGVTPAARRQGTRSEIEPLSDTDESETREPLVGAAKRRQDDGGEPLSASPPLPGAATCRADFAHPLHRRTHSSDLADGLDVSGESPSSAMEAIAGATVASVTVDLREGLGEGEAAGRAGAPSALPPSALPDGVVDGSPLRPDQPTARPFPAPPAFELPLARPAAPEAHPSEASAAHPQPPATPQPPAPLPAAPLPAAVEPAAPPPPALPPALPPPGDARIEEAEPPPPPLGSRPLTIAPAARPVEPVAPLSTAPPLAPKTPSAAELMRPRPEGAARREPSPRQPSPRRSPRSSRKLGRSTSASSSELSFGSGSSAVRLLPAPLNKNRVCEYGWLTPLLSSLVASQAAGVTDLASGTPGATLFVVCGGCPNSFCGMQAVLYTHMRSSPPELDFWWIKPKKEDGSTLERATLDRHSKGEHKNDPGRSRALYAQFADLFAVGGGAEAAARASRAGGGKLRFEVVGASGPAPRALIVDVESRAHYYIYLIWQEDWTSNPFARSKYIKGKLVYQRDPTVPEYFARPYAYRDGVLSVPPHAELEEAVAEPMPTDAIQSRCLDDS
ncbi:hypothetical protein EMIHUDRAFT_438567 [Emiliania huxleyi CCMP1516]|uniref:C2H2-type domain-containing protein n=2 Tax=Emiliania huxleyi TaxID=2903 RepID=A0A0D3I8C4_EMIH1|nr:hypothetical protein EMIHUDRAFT_438567 [Emiliania huxleyi CCMP1516]EOD07509.1 hypothetical protein EMIHUDRAFT_438567 [Emiliania huxleyi CCMP1516]|eukprot:XP_005759938.1 hypothetical protein EMIHUDRAFT_438567 [Emiliania huxleyi CCMP1516]